MKSKQLPSVINYPITPTENHIDCYHGIKVPDPYRWIEHNSDPRLKVWIEKQNEITKTYLNNLASYEDIKEQCTRIMRYETYSERLCCMNWLNFG